MEISTIRSLFVHPQRCQPSTGGAGAIPSISNSSCSDPKDVGNLGRIDIQDSPNQLMSDSFSVLRHGANDGDQAVRVG